MRTLLLLTTIGLLSMPALAGAQPPDTSSPSTPSTTGMVDLGVRGSHVSGDGARYERYRDLGDGLFVDVFRLEATRNTWILQAGGEHTGRRDQRYTVSAVRPGRFDAWFLWDQIPMLMSRSTRTLYDGIGTAVLTVADDLQAQVEASPAALATVFAASGRQFDTDSRRHIAEGGFRYLATPELTLRGTVRRTNRDGVIPYGGSFGHSSFVEVPAPVSHSLTNVDVGGEFQRGRWLARTGYSASLFHNDVTALAFDSPFRATDTAAAPSAGRLTLPPSSSSFTVNGLVSVQLPERSRVTAYVALGALSDAGDPIVPQTINSANAALIVPLDRTTVDGEARTRAFNLTFTSRPLPWADIRASVRTYDYDNRTPVFALTQRVSYDNAPASLLEAVHTEPFGLTRTDVDAELRLTPVRRLAAAVGFARLEEDRTHRIFESTAENVVRLTVDSIGHAYFTLRTKYEHGQKRGTGLDTSLLSAVGEQTGMRHFDVASRNRDRVTMLASVTPAAWVAVNASIAVGKDDYTESLFGLRDSTHRVYSVGADVAPSDTFSFGPSYSFERYTALSRSRQANPGVQFDDPSRNWATDATDRVHAFVLAAAATELAGRVDVSVSYDFNRARSLYEYLTGPFTDRTLPEEVVVDTTLPAPTRLPPTRSQLHRGKADLTYNLTGRVSIGVSYLYEDYQVDDFTLDADANPDLVRGQVLLIGYLYRPYSASTVSGRLVYRW